MRSGVPSPFKNTVGSDSGVCTYLPTHLLRVDYSPDRSSFLLQQRLYLYLV